MVSLSEKAQIRTSLENEEPLTIKHNPFKVITSPQCLYSSTIKNIVFNISKLLV